MNGSKRATLLSAARKAKRDLASWARPAGTFDASRYFRDTKGLRFYNVGTARVRRLARDIVRENPDWSVGDALRFADTLITDPYLEVKGVAIEVLARYRRGFAPSLLSYWKAWLARGHSSNWATTDAICGSLIGPLLIARPGLAATVAQWAGHSSLWVRRASAVGLIPLARKGNALNKAYNVAKRLRADREDLIQKAVGWLLREAGKTDMPRLERYLLREGRRMPRTSVRYAIERFPPGKRRSLLQATKAGL